MAASLVLNPTAIHNADRSFTVTGRISTTAGLKSIAISESLEDGRPSNFGTATVAADGTFSFKDRETFFKRGDFSATAFFTDGTTVQSAPAPYTFYADGHETTVGAAGQPATSITFNKDGSRDVSVLSGGQTLAAGFFDTFQNGSNPGDTFVYDPGHGGGLIRQFRGDGADHDTLSLKGADFGNSIAEVLADAHQFKGVGTVILDPTSGDTVRLANVSKAELAANRGDIVFHL